ncbi:MAG: tellurium resistance protein [Paracoccus sp. (in: a-proteobacteria)]|uniref:SLAC1 family transporter n=1 Tax=Paracoccus sp. TaxID=267 RepID=UPI0026DF84E3|nr:tellurium resistance protein [Paracoccus sp. (in: a-proteobacteria)]MDO5621063.1 tellurium resistance protein [Paracoccus sp. (in: a-proteobacteria)]
MRQPLPRFKAPRTAPAGRFRRVPPAIFPPLLGLMALALAWREGLANFALPPALAEFGAGMALALFAAAFSYAAKLVRRPSVLTEELEILPGRAGVAASVLCIYLAAALLAPYAPGLARALLLAGLAAHVGFLVVLIRVMLTGPAERRRVTPVWHLSFVGFIVAARVAQDFGWQGLAVALFWPSLLTALLIWIVSALQLRTETVPPPLRPLLMIHLAPVAVLGGVALRLGYPGAALAGWLALAGVLVALAGLRWLVAGGFSALWGAFTFPLAAVALFWGGLAAQGGETQRLLAGVLLIAATLVILPVFFQIWKTWANGQLATRSNAAIA